jgi:phage terminase large subunit-like protein
VSDHYTPDYSSFQPKHRKLMAYAEHPLVENIMAAGGIRSGKSITESAIVIRRAFDASGSSHGIFHAFANVCDRNLLNYTIPQTFNILMPGYWDEVIVKRGCVNHTDRIITLPNGSRLYFLGLDNRDKIRGMEFCTVWVNEANIGIVYDDITLLQGRLTQSATKLDGTPLQHKMLVDLNPTVKSSWEYQTFIEGKVPGDGSPLENKSAWRHVVINAIDNEPNLPPGTIKRLFAGMTAAQRARDERGEWSEDNPNALFNATTIGRKSAEIEDMAEIVVSLDPAGTSHDKSDSTGIIVAGKGFDGSYYVFEDASHKAKPEIWIKFAEKLRAEYDANWIISEKDYARDILEGLIDRVIPGAPIKYVESRGRKKRLRAEPIQALYAQGLVNHVPNPAKLTQFHALEQQMVEFDSPGFKGSPDRVDALVYALQHLSGISTAPAKLTVQTAQGFWRR